MQVQTCIPGSSLQESPSVPTASDNFGRIFKKVAAFNKCPGPSQEGETRDQLKGVVSTMSAQGETSAVSIGSHWSCNASVVGLHASTFRAILASLVGCQQSSGNSRLDHKCRLVIPDPPCRSSRPVPHAIDTSGGDEGRESNDGRKDV